MGDAALPAPTLPEEPDPLGVDVFKPPDDAEPQLTEITLADWDWDWELTFGAVFTVLGCLWTALLYFCYLEWSWAPMLGLLTAIFNVLLIIAVIVFWVVIARILWGYITGRKK